MKTRKFWPLDFDPEGEIYDNLAWDLPGYKRRKQTPRRIGSLRTKKSRRA